MGMTIMIKSLIFMNIIVIIIGMITPLRKSKGGRAVFFFISLFVLGTGLGLWNGHNILDNDIEGKYRAIEQDPENQFDDKLAFAYLQDLASAKKTFGGTLKPHIEELLRTYPQ